MSLIVSCLRSATGTWILFSANSLNIFLTLRRLLQTSSSGLPFPYFCHCDQSLSPYPCHAAFQRDDRTHPDEAFIDEHRRRELVDPCSSVTDGGTPFSAFCLSLSLWHSLYRKKNVSHAGFLLLPSILSQLSRATNQQLLS